MKTLSENKIRTIVRQELKEYLINEGLLDDLKKAFSGANIDKALQNLKGSIVGPPKPSPEFSQIKPILDTLKIPSQNIEKTYELLFKKEGDKYVFSGEDKGTSIDEAVKDITAMQSAIKKYMEQSVVGQPVVPAPLQESKLSPQLVLSFDRADSIDKWIDVFIKASEKIDPGNLNKPQNAEVIKQLRKLRKNPTVDVNQDILKKITSIFEDDTPVETLKDLIVSNKEKQQKQTEEEKAKTDKEAAEQRAKKREAANDPKNIKANAEKRLGSLYTKIKQKYETGKGRNDSFAMLTNAVSMFVAQVANLVFGTPNLQRQQVDLVNKLFTNVIASLNKLKTTQQAT